MYLDFDSESGVCRAETLETAMKDYLSSKYPRWSLDFNDQKGNTREYYRYKLSKAGLSFERDSCHRKTFPGSSNKVVVFMGHKRKDGKVDALFGTPVSSQFAERHVETMRQTASGSGGPTPEAPNVVTMRISYGEESTVRQFQSPEKRQREDGEGQGSNKRNRRSDV